MTETEKFLERCRGAGIVMGLGQMRRLLKKLNQPQDSMDFIQVAGTNGKGSVTSCLASVLSRAGYRTGSFASPAVFSPEETVRVDGVEITAAEMEAAYRQVELAAKQMEAEDGSWPTAFEAETAVALCCFREKGCRIAVLETGLGGDLDATNVVGRTLCCVFTSISRDHCRILGGTVAEIAGHKAGILKPGALAVSCTQTPEAEAVLKQKCLEAGTELLTVKPERISHCRILLEEFAQRFCYRSSKGTDYEIFLRLAGDFQRQNAAAVVEAAEALAGRGYPVKKEHIEAGLSEVCWHGRLERVRTNPVAVLDGAHNPGAAAELAAALQAYLPGKRLYFIMGIFADKDYRQVIRLTAGLAAGIVTVTAPGPRGLQAPELARAIREETGAQARAAVSMEEAVQIQLQAAGQDGAVIVFGSFSILKEARELLLTAQDGIIQKESCNGKS